jgi:hypothetical protein
MLLLIGKTINHPICVFSDCNTNNTVAVHSFLKVVIDYLKEMHQKRKKIIYFTDGAASQYKNYKNFINLLNHKNDFQLDGEWHIFATSHRKGPFDGIGGTIKRLARRASMQGEANIQTPLSLLNWCQHHVKNIKCFFVSSDNISLNEELLSNRF